jgi:hypothetical protein
MATRATSLAEARSHNVDPETFRRHYREIIELKKQHAETGMAVARAKKTAKANGIHLDALKEAEKRDKMDADEREVFDRRCADYARWLNMPIGSQTEMFGGPEKFVNDEGLAEHKEWEAGEGGAQAGKAGHQRDGNPFSAGTAEYVAWDKAWTKGNKSWLKGQEKIAAEMAIPPIPDETGNGAEPPRRRGRPKQDGAEAAIL